MRLLVSTTLLAASLAVVPAGPAAAVESVVAAPCRVRELPAQDPETTTGYLSAVATVVTTDDVVVFTELLCSIVALSGSYDPCPVDELGSAVLGSTVALVQPVALKVPEWCPVDPNDEVTFYVCTDVFWRTLSGGFGHETFGDDHCLPVGASSYSVAPTGDTPRTVRHLALGDVVIWNVNGTVGFDASGVFETDWTCRFESLSPPTVGCRPRPDGRRWYCGMLVAAAATDQFGAVRAQGSCRGNTSAVPRADDVTTREVGGGRHDADAEQAWVDPSVDVTHFACQGWGHRLLPTPAPSWVVACGEPYLPVLPA